MKNNSTNEDRRNFLKKLISGGIIGFFAVTLYPVIAFLKPPKQKEVEVSSITIENADDMKLGDSKIVRFGNEPVIIIKSGEEKFIAFSATCTHLDCTVQYKKEEGVIWCACHNGKYDLLGKNISGPPPKPLNRYNIEQKNNELVVTKLT